MFAFNATCVSDGITSLMKQIPAINAHLPSLLCTRAPRRRRAMGGSLPRRQRQSPPPKEPRKRRQRAPSWGTAPLANSLGTRSVRSSRRSRTLRNHRGLLAERERGVLCQHLARCAELWKSLWEHFCARGGWKPSSAAEFLSLGPL